MCTAHVKGVVMRLSVAVMGAVLLSAAVGAQERRGAITEVSAKPTGDWGNVQFVVRGTNPCGAVFLDFGDGTQGVTYPISELPATIVREYYQTGDFRVTARGMGNCDGSAPAGVRVNRARPQPAPPPQPATPPAAPVPAIRFAEMDANGDGVITRTEWQGSPRSFAGHDWNGDGRLAGDEVRIGASWPPSRGRGASATTLTDWSETRFRQLDRNGNGRLSRGEWRYDVEDFLRVDRNGDNQLTLNEFLIGDIDDDRGDRFDDLDIDGNNRIDRREWHGSLASFQWLDRNNDGTLSRSEMAGTEQGLGRIPSRAGVREEPRVAMVAATSDWTDTGVDLRGGDLVDVTATGRIFYAPGNGEIATAAGAAGRATAAAPMPDREIGALVGRIGGGPAFFVGAEISAYRVEGAGRLYLRVNDDILTDNRGQFRATITVTRR